MKPYFNTFNAAADVAIRDKMQRTRIIALAVALALSNEATIPSSQVDSAASHFITVIRPATDVALSAFNENVIFDCKAACDHFRSFWLLRYTAAHPTSRSLFSLADSFFESIFGVGSFMAPETVAFLNAHKSEVLMVAMAAAEAFAAMKAENA